MDRKKPSRLPKGMWAYAYQIVPPQPADRLQAITNLLDHENSSAQRGARTWSGRVVVEEKVTHILVVSDSPEQHGEVNRRLEAELNDLKAGFLVTAPMAVEDDGTQPPVTNGH